MFHKIKLIKMLLNLIIATKNKNKKNKNKLKITKINDILFLKNECGFHCLFRNPFFQIYTTKMIKICFI